MNFCKHCQANIPDKTARGTARTFCNKSCSRKYYIKHNPDKLVEAGKKSFETIKKERPDVIQNRGRLTNKKKEAMSVLLESGHYSKMGKLGSAAAIKSGSLFGGIEHTRNVLIASGKWIDYSVFDYHDVKRYRSAVRRLTRLLYGSAGNGFHWDHIVPISTGFKLSIPVEQLCQPENVKRLEAKQNLSKGSSITEEAQKILRNWNIQ